MRKRLSKRVFPILAAVALLVSFAGNTLATSNHDVFGSVAKSGVWTNYTQSRCMTATGSYPQLNLFTWAGNNSSMFYYIREYPSGVTIGAYGKDSPLQIPLHNYNTFNFGSFAQTHCFMFSARKNGIIFASGFEDWTGNANY